MDLTVGQLLAVCRRIARRDSEELGGSGQRLQSVEQVL